MGAHASSRVVLEAARLVEVSLMARKAKRRIPVSAIRRSRAPHRAVISCLPSNLRVSFVTFVVSLSIAMANEWLTCPPPSATP
jgi:hypothetical protein